MEDPGCSQTRIDTEGGSNERTAANPLDLDAANFDSEAYLSQLIKTSSLKELLNCEYNMVKDVKKLDADMQQLVYENYNKFISGSETIRNMRLDFASMEREMDELATSMERMQGLSGRVAAGLSTQHGNVQRLAKANRTLKTVEFVFELPTTLQAYVERKQPALAVRAYVRARPLLERYRHVPSFGNICAECDVIVGNLRDSLREQMHDAAAPADTASAVHSLVQLGEPTQRLADHFLESARERLRRQAADLDDQVRLKSGDTSVRQETMRRPSDAIPNMPVDVLELVDNAVSNYLSDVALTVTAYGELFVSRADDDADAISQRLVEFVNEAMRQCLDVVERRFVCEHDPAESSLTVRALDRFYRRVAAADKILPDAAAYTGSCLALIRRVAERHVELSYEQLMGHLNARIKDARQQLAAGQKTLAPPSDAAASYQMLGELLSNLEQSCIRQLKTALANMQQFVAHDVNFANKGQFALDLGVLVREKMVVRWFDDVSRLGDEFCTGRGDKAFVNSTLILVLSRFCKNLQTSTSGYLVDQCEQQFGVGGRSGTAAADVGARLGAVSHRLLDHFVEMEGGAISQLLVKSVETRDWLGCVEPRSVRAVMKRVVEDLTAIDSRVGQLLDEGARKAGSSDSSRRTPGMYSGRPLGDSSMGSTLGKLWTERVDYFASVDFNKVSVLTGVVKMCLKTLLESVRLKTFGKYGLQQVQVDCHYLQLYLWRFVFDEQLVHCLLDEVVSSAVHRCQDPHLMDPSVVQLISDRG